ncbi:MAG: 4-hydroxythreonine-4-phosphate dehydrogenase PdxA [Methyloligellaceae bacterium]
MMTTTSDPKPRIAAIPGDANGIGPELLARLLVMPKVTGRADILVIGDRPVIARGEREADVTLELAAAADPRAPWPAGGTPYFETAFIDADQIAPGTVSAASGQATLRTLDIALDLARDGVVDGILFAPFNKEAMIAGGMGHGDELHYMAEYLGYEGHVSELNIMGGLWTSRVTSHIPLRDVADTINEDRILDAVKLVERELKASGVQRPSIAVCALNPHAGDGGNFGTEEIDVIRPAVEKARSFQIDVSGPWPSDTIFLKAQAGEVDAIVTMYHDQGQIAMKLMGFHKGVTVQGGLPVPVATPAHGTAYDISGQGIARTGAIEAAFDVLVRMAASRRAQSAAA